MRLFYIIIFFCIPYYFVSAASQIKNDYALDKSANATFLSNKIQCNFHQQMDMEAESIQKDFVSNAPHKFFSSIILFLLFATIFLNVNIPVFKKTAKITQQYYRCSFKMLYPKHVFW